MGDDSNSWAYDGSRQRKWHAGSAYYGQYWYAGAFSLLNTRFCLAPSFWNCAEHVCVLLSRTDRPAGDYIGVAIDLDAKKMDFYRNGHNMGTAYDNFSVGDGLYPAVTLSGGNPEQP